MKKNRFLYITVALGGMALGTMMAQTAVSPILVTCNELAQRGDSLYIDATFRIKGGLLESCKSLTLTPVLETEQQKEGFPSILLNGKRNAKVYSREVALRNRLDEPRFVVLRDADASEHKVDYKMTVPFESWMKDARFVLAQDLCGCGQNEAVAPLLIADKVRSCPTERYEVKPLLAYITPIAETEKQRAEVGTAYLDFPVGQSQILADYRSNSAELRKINETIRTVLDDKNVTPKGIFLKGFASPDGAYAANERLADRRVKALRDYIRTQNNFNADFFTLASVPEDWAGFRSKVEADQGMPSRSEVLAIIDGNDAPDRKEAQIKALGGGAAYAYAMTNFFPSLRRSEYRIDYKVRFFTVTEGREVVKTHPQQLSLNELFAIANSYDQGSDEYNEVFAIAVRMFSSDPVANLNAANIALAKGDYKSARAYLGKAGESPEAIHARGVLCLMEGRLDEAAPLLEQAAAAGIPAAKNNLNELRKKQQDNALFDSFTPHKR